MSNYTKTEDYILPFLIDNLSVNGKFISLSQSVTEIINKHNYADDVSKILCEGLALIAMIGHSLKSESILSAEITSDDLSQFMAIDYIYPGDIRGYCDIKPNSTSILRGGKLIMTIDKHGHRYQGIVKISHDNLTDAFLQYLKESQQIQSTIKIAINKDSGENWSVNGVMAQKLPEGSETDWERAKIFIDTITDQELRSSMRCEADAKIFAPENLLYKLFHQDKIFIYDKSVIKHKCRCSREKIEKMLSNLSQQELDYYKVAEKITIRCQFCNKEEIF